MSHTKIVLDHRARRFYIDVMNLLTDAEMPFMLGGAYALAQYSGVERHTKDLDLFVRKSDCQAVIEIFEKAGYKAELVFAHWLGKAYKDENFIDIIFSSGNGVATVDDLWFEHSTMGNVFGVDVLLCPPEEMIWSKGYIMERERFDGADIAHIIHACFDTLDWDRLIMRFADDWRVLLSHLILFEFIYPAEKNKIPKRVKARLIERLLNDETEADEKLCQGTLLSRAQYLVDVEQRGYEDARLIPVGKMSAGEIDHWTLAIEG